MKLYNSYTQKIDELVPAVPGEISMYVCGPTVYNDPHIGNARPIVVFDTLAKALKAQGYKVTYASNYTDVDDKIINKALEEGKSEKEITDRYISAYEKIRSDLHADNPDYAPRVTETMERIIAFIEDLVEKDAAYASQGDVYYRVNSDPHYGELSHQKTEDLLVGARIDENEKKENPLDFTLWKTTGKGIQWDSPWGPGRPGWHTECVVMIHDVFGKNTIDLHGGGMDLKFPHHENEMAQNRSFCCSPLANMWVHNGMINIDNREMHKSTGNVLLAKDLIEQYGGPACRFAMIYTHYRAPLNISHSVLESAVKEVEKMRKTLKQAVLLLSLQNASADEAPRGGHWEKFLAALDYDLNTPNGISELQAVIKEINIENRRKETDFAKLSELLSSAKAMLHVLGVDIAPAAPDQSILDLYRGWKDAAGRRDFETADTYRRQLMETGWI